jgi:hypothetical protein
MSETPSGPKPPTRDEISEVAGKAIENMEPVSRAEAEAAGARWAEIDARVSAQDDDFDQAAWDQATKAADEAIWILENVEMSEAEAAAGVAEMTALDERMSKEPD